MHDGPTRFVLIRGLAREAGHWHALDRTLLERFGDAAIERVDLPGNGARWRERSPLDIATMAADLRARVWAADRRAPVLIAISLGAMVCLEWLRRWPADPIVGLVAINTSAGGLSAPWERLRPAAWVHTASSLLERDPVARELSILALTSREHRDDRALAERHAGLHRERPIRRANAVRQMIAAARFRVGERPSIAPVLLLNSAGDRMVDPRCSAKLARTLEASLEVHPTAGHDLSLDDPQWCVERMHAWLSAGSFVTHS